MAPPPQALQYGYHPYTGQVQILGYPVAVRVPSKRWRIPEAGAPQYITLACAVVALFGGWAAFHSEGVGIGLALTGLAMTVVPLLVGGREALSVRIPGAVLVAGLWSVAAVRDAGWIVTLCAFTALLLTPLVLAPHSRFSGIASAAFGYLGGLAGAFRWANRGYRRPTETGNAMRNLRVVAITVGLLVVFGGLFVAADSNFAAIVADLVPEINLFSLFWRTVLTVILFGLVLLWAYVSIAKPRYDPEEPDEPKPASRFEVAVPLGALNLLFAAFIALQARVLFGGDEYVMETAGLTMAEYARSGFWQLSVVAVLALGVIAVAAWKAPRRERADRWVARILLGALCVMSLAIVASAMFRMSRYFESFGLTRLRLWVFTVEIWLAILFVLVLVCCWKLRATWLPRAILGSGAAVLLGLAAINPDGFIAGYNVDRFEETGKFDPYYAAGLSADAADALAELPDDERECVFDRADWGDDDRPALAWNYGWGHGHGLAETHTNAVGAECVHLDSIDGIDEYGSDDPLDSQQDPYTEPDRSEEPTAPATDTGPAAGAGYFHWDTCDLLDLTAAEELFGTSAKGDYGVMPDEAHQTGGVFGAELADDETPYAYLECAYYGSGASYLRMEVKQWSDSEGAQAVLAEDRDDRERSHYTVADLDGAEGFTAVSNSETYPELKYSFVEEDLVYGVSIMAGPTDEGAREVCAGLADQLRTLYQELA
ncbi:DUF4153 domain-containing protein [Glycomyces arizonensis]|uniref:DUF4153 domain-containing protein n=1 Tax=Glycomyces arizonensis TaxID=256035 RepID=UPI000686239A|nr:DUF4173 domain-containing protein [Glycomyces arizonensis]